MNANQLRQRFLTFFEAHDHAVIRNAPLIPENDPSVLFTTAGMHPLAPYLLGASHPSGQRLTNVQKCVRTNDILEVGDDTHLTFFEMLGNWSLGAYWKAEALRLNYTLFTEVFGHDPERLHVTCFAGDDDAPRDDEAAAIWQEIGIPAARITFLPKAENWWGPAGITGPCGPDSEVFYDLNPTGPPGENPATNPQRFVEIGNNVFMAYEKRQDGSYRPLAQRNVDVGIGLERNLMILQRCATVFGTDLLLPIVEAIQSVAHTPADHLVGDFPVRVIADHLRAAMLILAEGVRPGKTDQPYIVRRLLRRAIRCGQRIGIQGPFLARLAETVIPTLHDAYPALDEQLAALTAALDDEEQKFQRTLVRGERKLTQLVAQCHTQGQTTLLGDAAFHLYETYGFPVELIEETAQAEGLALDMAGYQRAFTQHQTQSRQGAAARFKGGLAERNPVTIKLHTATHLLQAALRQVLGPHVEQRGSNITSERLRFDFSHDARLTDAQRTAVETLVNAQIAADLSVTWQEMNLADAQQMGALGIFTERYGERVKVYTIGDFSTEVCGGPHVARLGELGRFYLGKQESVAAGIRRIKATLGCAGTQ